MIKKDSKMKNKGYICNILCFTVEQAKITVSLDIFKHKKETFYIYDNDINCYRMRMMQ